MHSVCSSAKTLALPQRKPVPIENCQASVAFIIARKELGGRQSILLGIGLSVRFSTSIVIVKILFENGLIQSDLYSVIIASSMAFKFIVPVLFSNLLVRWKVAGVR